MRLTILYDNLAEGGLGRGHGFSCLVEGERNILFDTGWDGNLLLSNMSKLGLSMKDVDAIFLSHSHWDHTGGLPTLLSVKGSLDVYFPKWFSRHLKEEVESRAGLKEISVASQIARGTYTTGEVGEEVKEQSLFTRTSKGIMVVTGCSHPGLRLILERAQEIDDVYGVVGGFHEFDEYRVLEGLGLIVPCHCTKHKREIKKLYSEECEIGFSGKIIEVDS